MDYSQYQLCKDATLITENDLKTGANIFQRFWLRPLSGNGRIIPLRLCINSRFGGWKLKDELVVALGLKVGDCITTEVSVLFAGNLINDEDDIDLFADGSAADWLLDEVSKVESPIGCIIDAFVELSYCEAPVGGVSGKMVGKASLILRDGIRVISK